MSRVKDDTQAAASKENESVPALRRAVRILDFVGASDVPPTAAEIARALALPRSSTHGLAGVMTELGLLEPVAGPGSGYRLGTRLLDWATHVSSRQDLIGAFHHVLSIRPDLAPYTVSLSTLEGDQVVYLASRVSERGLGVHYNVGLRLPAIYTATGRAQLSAMDQAAFREWLTLYPPATWPGPLTTQPGVTSAEIIEDVRRAQQNGYAVDDGYVQTGVWCFAAPVHDGRGMTVAGLGLSQPKPADTEAARKELAALAVSAAAELSLRLGYRPR